MATSSGFASKSFENFGVSREELARQHFEPQLARIGLSVEQIEKKASKS